MIRFVNLDNGNVYNSDNTYIHYFKGPQSINLIYTHCICAITDETDFKQIMIRMNSNPVFKLLDMQRLNESNNIDRFYTETISNIKYINIHLFEKNVIKLNKNNIYDYGDYKLFLIYFDATTPNVGEYIEEFVIQIDDTPYPFKIGADFYDENEMLKIELNNMGVEIPKEIQKSIYTSNVHEDKFDNILLNRKFKELISNYWNVIANKGSYKSLENSLKWFEYPEGMHITEFWSTADHEYCEMELNSLMKDKYEDFLLSHYKTNNIAINFSNYHIKELETSDQLFNGEYDDERNPELIENDVYVSKQITYNDLMLKMSMLGTFFETYFMPIHLKLIRCTIEDVVFTNTIKMYSAETKAINDIFTTFGLIKCNIDNDKIFYLKTVHADPKVNVNTSKMENYDDVINSIYNNDKTPLRLKWMSSAYNNKDLKFYAFSNYSGPGVVVPLNFEMYIPDDEDFIKKETVLYNFSNDEWKTIKDYLIYNNRIEIDLEKVKKGDAIELEKLFGHTNLDNINVEDYINKLYPNKKFIKTKNILITANLLCTKSLQYNLLVEFETASGIIYNKKIKFEVRNLYLPVLTLYKIEHNHYPLKFDNSNINNLFFGRIRNKQNLTHNLYVPFNVNSKHYNNLAGILLSNVLGLKAKNEIKISKYINDNYFVFEKNNSEYICVSKFFNFKPDLKEIVNDYNVIRNDYDYFPEFHKAIKMCTKHNRIEEFTITDHDTLCVKPNIPYGEQINNIEWIFENITTGEKILIPESILEPFVANIHKEKLTPGFYNIIFNYSLEDGVLKTIKLNSAFVKK